MKPKPVRQRQSNVNLDLAYAILEEERQRIGDDAFERWVKQTIIDNNLKTILAQTKGIDAKVEITRQAHELRKSV